MLCLLKRYVTGEFGAFCSLIKSALCGQGYLYICNLKPWRSQFSFRRNSEHEIWAQVLFRKVQITNICGAKKASNCINGVASMWERSAVITFFFFFFFCWAMGISSTSSQSSLRYCFLQLQENEFWTFFCACLAAYIKHTVRCFCTGSH